MFSAHKRNEVLTISTQADRLIEAAKQLSLDELEVVSEHILAMLDDMKWDELLASPQFQADMERMTAEIEADIAAGRIIKYIPGKSFAELFQD